MSFALYIAGFVLVIAGVAWGLDRSGLSAAWIAIIALILFGIGMVRGVSHARSKDPSA